MKLKNMSFFYKKNLCESSKYGLHSQVCNLLNPILGMNQETHSNIEGWNNKKYWFKKLAKTGKKNNKKNKENLICKYDKGGWNH
jgi:hypothetical protein